MRSSGISEMRALRPIVGMAVLLAILIGLFSLFVRPWAYGETYEIKARAEASTEVDRIRPARFLQFRGIRAYRIHQGRFRQRRRI